MRAKLTYELNQLNSFFSDEQQSRFSLECIQRMQKRIWVLKGMLKFGFKQSNLEEVAEKYERLGLDLDGYMCPQLYKFNHMPDALGKVICKAE